VFGADTSLERLSAVLVDIASSLEAGDLVKAQLLALTIPISTLDYGVGYLRPLGDHFYIVRISY
jgi:hypothetical protein